MLYYILQFFIKKFHTNLSYDIQFKKIKINIYILLEVVPFRPIFCISNVVIELFSKNILKTLKLNYIHLEYIHIYTSNLSLISLSNLFIFLGRFLYF